MLVSYAPEHLVARLEPRRHLCRTRLWKTYLGRFSFASSSMQISLSSSLSRLASNTSHSSSHSSSNTPKSEVHSFAMYCFLLAKCEIDLDSGRPAYCKHTNVSLGGLSASIPLDRLFGAHRTFSQGWKLCCVAGRGVHCWEGRWSLSVQL